MIVTVTPEDFGSDDILAGVEFQRKLERAAYELGGGKVPVQLFGDFCQNIPTTTLGEVEPCIKGQYTFANVRNIFPAELSSALEEGIHGCEKLIRGFDRPGCSVIPVWRAGLLRRCGSCGMRPLKVRSGDFIPVEREPDMQVGSHLRPWTD